MLKRLMLTGVALAILVPSTVQAQTTMMQSVKNLNDGVVGYLMSTARMVDEDLYDYRPTEEVRSMGEILAHLATAQYMFCAAVAGEDSPNAQNFEETATTKAEIVAALVDAFAYCEGVYARTTDAMATRELTFFGQPNTVAGVLAFNTGHNYEHYGNLVTYMRINGITPPSSM
jgi:uncharacterized damage-inducible protein DinB